MIFENYYAGSTLVAACIAVRKTSLQESYFFTPKWLFGYMILCSDMNETPIFHKM